MDLDKVIALINQCGFPVFVALVLLLRVDRMHQANILALNALTKAIDELKLLVEIGRHKKE